MLSSLSRGGRPPFPRSEPLRTINFITLLLVIIGGLNWLLVGAFNFDLVAALFGEMSPLSRIIYVLVGASALWQFIPLFNGMSEGETNAQRA